MSRPDQSFYLAHFTKNGKDYDPAAERINPTVDQMSALERLIHIMQETRINATNMNWTNKPAVCFTECPWGSLLRHASNYSSYGIGFTKKLIYSCGGNPVIYANPDMFNAQNWDENVYPFVTPLVPSYAPASIKRRPPFCGKAVDYSHEREWRVTKDFPFQYIDVQFVILDKVNDLKHIPQGIIDSIGIDKFLFMDSYKKSFNAKSWGQYVAVTLNAAFDRSEAHVWQEGNRAKTSGSIGFSMSDECFITLSSHIADGGAITAFYTFPQDFALILKR